MSLLDKIKILLWINKEVSMLEKIKGIAGKLDGYKSLLGLLGVVGYYGAKAYGVNPPEAILNTSYGLLGVGLVHKLDKATDIIKKVLPVLSTILGALDKKKEETK
jgi:hypothetical protein